MKKYVISMVMVAMLMATGIQALELNGTFGISTINMQNVNQKIESSFEQIKTDPMLVTTFLKDERFPVFAYDIGAEVLWSINENVKIGLKTGYMTTPMIEVQSKSVGDTPLDLIMDIDLKQTSYMIPILVGGKYTFKLNEKTKINIGLFAGVALEYYRIAKRTDFSGSSTIPGTYEEDNIYTDYSICGQTTLDVDYNIINNISFIGSLGYRYAKAENMKAKKDLGYTIDFSGITLTAGVKIVL